MNVHELGKILSQMYHNAPHGNQVAKIHLFGVKYADVILRNNFSVKDIVKALVLILRMQQKSVKE